MVVLLLATRRVAVVAAATLIHMVCFNGWNPRGAGEPLGMAGVALWIAEGGVDAAGGGGRIRKRRTNTLRTTKMPMPF